MSAFPEPKNEAQTAIHNARVAASIIEDELNTLPSDEGREYIKGEVRRIDEMLIQQFEMFDPSEIG